MSTLHPAEDPGDGAQILESPTLRAARRARTDARRVQFVDRSCLLEIFQYVGIVGDLTAVDTVRLLRHLFEGFFPADGIWGVPFLRPRQCFQTRRDHQFQIPFGEDGIGIFPVKNLALLGDANLTGKTSRRLSEDGGMRRPAAASYSSTATMKEAKLYPIFLCCLMQFAMSFIEFPGTGQHASVFVGVGITKHDFLPAPPGIKQRLVLGIAPQAAHYRTGGSE